MIVDHNINRSFANIKVGDKVQICVGFATLDLGNGHVTRVGRQNFDVLSKSASGVWTFRKVDGKAAPGINQSAFVITEEEAKQVHKAYKLGARQSLVLHKKTTALYIGEGEI
jgi:hypothetical protein